MSNPDPRFERTKPTKTQRYEVTQIVLKQTPERRLVAISLFNHLTEEGCMCLFTEEEAREHDLRVGDTFSVSFRKEEN